MRNLKLMSDYHCWPLWENNPDTVGNVDPRLLPLSEDLIIELENWAQTFDATLNTGDPAASGFTDSGAEQAFRQAGLLLLQKLRQELGPNYEITISSHLLPESQN